MFGGCVVHSIISTTGHDSSESSSFDPRNDQEESPIDPSISLVDTTESQTKVPIDKKKLLRNCCISTIIHQNTPSMMNRSILFTSSLLLLAVTEAAQIHRLNKAPPPPLFDPATFCHDVATSHANLYCNTVEFPPDGDIPANVVKMVTTREAQDVATKECLKHITFAAKLAESVTSEEQLQTKKADEASKRKARDFCERVHWGCSQLSKKILSIEFTLLQICDTPTCYCYLYLCVTGVYIIYNRCTHMPCIK